MFIPMEAQEGGLGAEPSVGCIPRSCLLQKGDRSWKADSVVRRACRSAEYPCSAPSTQAGQLTGADNSSSRDPTISSVFWRAPAHT